jgi:hypothetical protein
VTSVESRFFLSAATRSLTTPSRIDPSGMNMLVRVSATTAGSATGERRPSFRSARARPRWATVGTMRAITAFICLSTGAVSSAPRSIFPSTESLSSGSGFCSRRYEESSGCVFSAANHAAVSASRAWAYAVAAAGALDQSIGPLAGVAFAYFCRFASASLACRSLSWPTVRARSWRFACRAGASTSDSRDGSCIRLTTSSAASCALMWNPGTLASVLNTSAATEWTSPGRTPYSVRVLSITAWLPSRRRSAVVLA